MSSDPQNAQQEFSGHALGSLDGCLVEGNPEQRRRERHLRRRALVISVALQAAVLVVLMFVPLFGKPERIAMADTTPIPPYVPYGNHNAAHPQGAQAQPHRGGPRNVCHFCISANTRPRIPNPGSASPGNDVEGAAIEGVGPGIPGALEGIPLADNRQRIRIQEEVDHRTERRHVLHVTHLDPAMLVRRVEPIYPFLAKQLHREGRVELRAIIATDGTIQSLQAVAGDPFFYKSALDAVQQWRYKPTILNGQPVEIDTYITVIYSLQR